MRDLLAEHPRANRAARLRRSEHSEEILLRRPPGTSNAPRHRRQAIASTAATARQARQRFSPFPGRTAVRPGQQDG
jgi:hypothetical protein